MGIDEIPIVEKSEDDSDRDIKSFITNEDLVALGFPEFILEKSQFFERHYVIWEYGQADFYNALYTLVKLYQKYTGKTMTVSHQDNSVYLNGKEVLCFHSGKRQNLYPIKRMIEELLVYFDNDFDALKREFVKLYAEEKAKTELSDGIEIYSEKVARRLPTDKEAKYLNKANKILEFVETNFGEREVLIISRTMWFGERYYYERGREKLKDVIESMKKREYLPTIEIYDGYLMIGYYAISLSGKEMQEILKLNNLFENEL